MYRSIQLCRAVAAGMVMLLHLTGVIAAAKYFGLRGVDTPFRCGQAGVEFFFVLSGFIITYVHWNDFGNPARLTRYVKKRAIRIYPTYWLIFVPVYLMAVIAVGNSVVLSPAELIKNLTLWPQMSPDSTIGTYAPSFIGVAWSLQYEILFYVLMAVFIVNRPLGGLIGAAVLTNLLGCRAHYCVVPASYLQTNFILLFGLGGITAVYCKNWTFIKYPRILAAIGAATFVFAGVWNDVTNLRLTLVYGLASAAIVLGLVKAEDEGKLRISWESPVLLGDASYALYLLHFPLIVLLSKIAVGIGLHGLSGAIVSAPVIIAACIASAIAFHRFVESPLLRGAATPRIAV